MTSTNRPSPPTPVRIALVLLTALGTLAPTATPAPMAIPEARLTPAKDTGRASVTGTITGGQIHDFVVAGTEGDRAKIELSSDHPRAYFNLRAPGADRALFIGATHGETLSGILPATGDYRIRVYLTRPAAHEGKSTDYALHVRVTAAGGVKGPVRGDHADGLAGGPDHWAVTRLRKGGRLNLRAGPSTSDTVLDSLPAGTVLKNRGCRRSEGRRWCRVERVDDTKLGGWVAGSYLREVGYAGDKQVPTPPEGAGPAKHDLSGNLPCSAVGPSLDLQCPFRVVRGATGATSWVSDPTQVKTPRYRVIDVVQGRFTARDGAKLEAGQSDRGWRLTISQHEHYLVPDVVLHGG